MASEGYNEVPSDTETAEKPVRDQLEKATISKTSNETLRGDAEDSNIEAALSTENGRHATPEAEQSNNDGDKMEESTPQGKLTKKRSIEDVDPDELDKPPAESTRSHTRKRSRDGSADEEELNNGQRKSGERSRDVDTETHSTSNGQPKEHAAERPTTPEQHGAKRSEASVEAMTSPKTKRSRLQPSTDEDGTDSVSSDAAKTSDKIESLADSTTEEKAATKIPPTSGFANTSAASPFASLSGSRSPLSETKETSASAFAASGFSALSGSSTSGFGALGKTTGGFGTGAGFGGGGKSPLPATDASKENEDKAKSSTFGGALGQQSAFGGNGFASSSGFGKLGGGGGFGSGAGFGTLGGGGGLTSFASGKPSGFKSPKPFGAPKDEADDEEEAGDGDDSSSGIKSPLSQEVDKQDERFFVQEVETGEEDEFTDYSCRAKLYNFVTVGDGKKEWKERGLGVVRLNVKNGGDGEEDDEDDKPSARLLMRADGSHRVILNTPVKKEIKFGAPHGGPPQGGSVLFMGTVDGKAGLELLQLKMRQQFATELYEKITWLQEAM